MKDKKIAIAIGCIIGYITLCMLFGFKLVNIVLFMGAIAYGIYKNG